MTRKSKILTVLSIVMVALLAVIFISCGPKKNDEKFIAVSIVPQVEFVKQVVGDDYKVVAYVPEGKSPESYEPSAKTIVEMEKAVLFFTIGMPSEKTITGNAVLKDKIVELDKVVAKKLPVRYMKEHHHHDEEGEIHEHEHEHEHAEAEEHDHEHEGEMVVDPHIWLSPDRTIIMVQEIADQLSAINSANKDKYQANAKKYIDQIKQAKADVKKVIDAQHIGGIIVYHPAYGYFVDEFGIKMYALEEDGKEATAEHLKEITDIAKAQGIKAIYYQAQMDSAQAITLAKEINGTAVQLNPLAPNYIENLKLIANTIAKNAK